MNCKKIVAFILCAMLISTFCVTAFAATSSLEIGQTKYKTYNITSAPTYKIRVAGKSFQKIKITLSYWDKEVEDQLIKKYKKWEKVPKEKKNTVWKISSSKTVTLSRDTQVAQIIVSQGKDFKFVKGRTPKARLSFTAGRTVKSTSNDPMSVTYPD